MDEEKKKLHARIDDLEGKVHALKVIIDAHLANPLTPSRGGGAAKRMLSQINEPKNRPMPEHKESYDNIMKPFVDALEGLIQKGL